MSELPKGWATSTLGEIANASVEQLGPDTRKSTFTYIDISAIDRAAKQIANPQTVDVKQAPSRARQCLLAGDVLVSMTRPNLNAVALVPAHLDYSIGSTGFYVLRSERMSQPWLAYRVQAEDFISTLSMKVQGALYPAVRPKDIAGFRVNIPPRSEQDRIVSEIEEQFTRLDAATAALKRVQANLKRYRASVLKAACEGHLVPTEAELARKEGRDYEPADKLLQRILRERRARWEADTLAKMQASGKPPKDDSWKRKYKEPAIPDTSKLPTLPEGWCWVSVEQISNKVVDGVHHKPNYVPEGIPFITVKNLTAGPGISFEHTNFITPEDHAEFIRRADPRLGDILVSKDGTLGTIRAVRTDETFSIFVSVAMIKPVLRETSDFLELALTAPQVQIQMVPKGSGLQHIHLEDLREDCVPFAPLGEQARVVAECSRLLTLMDATEGIVKRNIIRGTAVRSSILRSAFTGQLVPQDPTDEPASILLERICAKRTSPSKAKPRSGRKVFAHV